jgi:N-hydroxyarylamine O-acetyltransferase
MQLRLVDVEVKQDNDTFVLNKSSEHGYLLKALVDGTWANQYAFDLSPQDWIDFAPANYLNSTHPEAVFVQKLLIVLHNHSGRKILFGDMLKTIENGKVEKQTIAPQDTAAILSRHFGLVE